MLSLSILDLSERIICSNVAFISCMRPLCSRLRDASVCLRGLLGGAVVDLRELLGDVVGDLRDLLGDVVGDLRDLCLGDVVVDLRGLDNRRDFRLGAT